MAFLRALAASALVLLAISVAPAAARELSQLDSCAGAVPPDGVFQITARGTFECGRSGANGDTTPGENLLARPPNHPPAAADLGAGFSLPPRARGPDPTDPRGHWPRSPSLVPARPSAAPPPPPARPFRPPTHRPAPLPPPTPQAARSTSSTTVRAQPPGIGAKPTPRSRPTPHPAPNPPAAGGNEKQCSGVAPWNQPQVRGYPTFSITKRSYWKLNTNADGTGTVSTYSRDCPNGKQSYLTVNAAGEPVLSAKPGVWKFLRTKATGALFCDDYALQFVRSGEALTITGELSCEAPKGNGLVMAKQSGALDQQLVISVVFGKPVPGI